MYVVQQSGLHTYIGTSFSRKFKLVVLLGKIVMCAVINSRTHSV